MTKIDALERYEKDTNRVFVAGGSDPFHFLLFRSFENKKAPEIHSDAFQDRFYALSIPLRLLRQISEYDP